MTEDNEKERIKIKLKTKTAEIEVELDSFEEIDTKQEEFFRTADFFYKINSIFELREKYSNLYSILPKELIIHYNENKWLVWEKVLLILLSNHSFETQRRDIWNYDISGSTLRGIIRDKTEYIESVNEDTIKLTAEGLTYILEKLNTELRSYRNELKEENNNE